MNNERKCVVCGSTFVLPGTRGRPPTKCDECRGVVSTTNVERKLTANERLDRLDTLLKSRNLHISQHTE